MQIVGHSKKETGNHGYASYVLTTHDVKWIISAPYLSEFKHPHNKMPNPHYDAKKASQLFQRHGSGVSAVGIQVEDVAQAYEISTKNGATGVVKPTVLQATEEEGGGKVHFAEIIIYDDVTDNPLSRSDTVLRFIQYDNFKGPFLPGYKAFQDPHPLDYGIQRMDHCVGNVYRMDNIIADLKKWLGVHSFTKFTNEEIQTPWTSLNSEVVANNNLRVLLPINESAPGKKESQILEFLKAYNGPGVQHLALKSNNVFETVMKMRSESEVGFQFLKTHSSYYEDPVIIKRMQTYLEPTEIIATKELGILVDEDDEGVLLQIFTQPLFDRPTIFVEIIQRKCKGETIDVPGCGGFGKGNFKSLFEAIERAQQERGGLLDSVY